MGGSGKGTGKSMRMRFSKPPFNKLPFSFSPNYSQSCLSRIKIGRPLEIIVLANPSAPLRGSKSQMGKKGRIRFRRVRFQTPNSVSFFGPHQAQATELSEFLVASYLCAKANSPSFSQNRPSLPQKTQCSGTKIRGF